jgi:hypothetical protein
MLLYLVKHKGMFTFSLPRHGKSQMLVDYMSKVISRNCRPEVAGSTGSYGNSVYILLCKMQACKWSRKWEDSFNL